MSDTANDIGTAARLLSQGRRANNREWSAGYLIREQIEHTSRNSGAHLIVMHAGLTVDFWPGTGLWIVRGSKRQGRGIRDLINHLRYAERCR